MTSTDLLPIDPSLLQEHEQTIVDQQRPLIKEKQLAQLDNVIKEFLAEHSKMLEQEFYICNKSKGLTKRQIATAQYLLLHKRRALRMQIRDVADLMQKMGLIEEFAGIEEHDNIIADGQSDYYDLRVYVTTAQTPLLDDGHRHQREYWRQCAITLKILEDDRLVYRMGYEEVKSDNARFGINFSDFPGDSLRPFWKWFSETIDEYEEWMWSHERITLVGMSEYADQYYCHTDAQYLTNKFTWLDGVDCESPDHSDSSESDEPLSSDSMPNVGGNPPITPNNPFCQAFGKADLLPSFWKS